MGTTASKNPPCTAPLSTNLKVYYANVDNSLLSKFEELCSVVAETSYDIVALNEVKPKNGIISMTETLNLDGYDLFISNLSKKDTRGVCIYVKKHLKASQVTPNTSKKFNDFVWVRISEQSNSNNQVLIGCIYRSGTPETASKYDNALHEQLLWASKDKKSTHKIIVGDFNMPNITWTPDPILSTHSKNSDQIFVEIIRDAFLNQLVTENTRFRNNSASKLDLVFTNEISIVEKLSFLDPLGASDHVGISFEITGISCSYSKKKITLYNRANYEKLRTILSKVTWNDVFNSDTSLQESYDLFEIILNSSVDKCVPTKIILEKPQSKPLWMTSNLTKGCKEKIKLWEKFKLTKNKNVYKLYAKARNKYSHNLRAARKIFEKNVSKNIKNNVKGFWNYVNSKKKNKTKVNALVNAKGIFITDDTKKAELLNTQYSSIFTIENLENVPLFKQTTLTDGVLSDITISEEDVKNELLSLRVDKSPGNDQVHPRILKEAALQLCTPLTKLFQLSIKQGKVPQQWKEANIIPIFKKGSRSDPSNYRPVSLTSILSKLLEKIISKNILKHILRNKILPKQQHGFLHGKSTSTNLLEAMNVWIEMLEHKMPVDIIYLDYSKAFDTVPHKRLLLKLEAIGIRGNVLHWIEDFLYNRRQRVIVNEAVSNWADVLSGVPQGSVLGPLLFIIFISEIPSLINNFVSLFADDTKLYGIPGSELQNDLTKVVNWTKEMQMTLNSDKCKTMHLGKTNEQFQYIMEDNEKNRRNLKTTEVEKDLGVHIDSNLGFTEHITNQVNKANGVLGALKHTFKYIDIKSFRYLYKGLIRPHLEYASVTWSARFKYNQDLLERVQRRATKIVPEIKHLGYSDRLRALGLPTLMYRRKRADVIQMFKFIHGYDYFDLERCCHICRKPVFEKSLSCNTRGHPYKLQQHTCGSIKQSSYFGRVVPMWNQLRTDTVCSETINQFKNNLAKEWDNHKDKFQYTFSY